MIKTTFKAAILLNFLTGSIGLACFAHEGEHESKPAGTHLGTVHGVIGDSMCKSNHKKTLKAVSTERLMLTASPSARRKA